MLVVVSDSSPLVSLTRLGQLLLLRRLHEAVWVPRAVWDEVAMGGRGLPESEHLQHAVADGWIRVKAPVALLTSLGRAAAPLGRGELEAIALAKELGALLLTDDEEGRDAAESIGLKVTGTVGVLIRAKVEGHISSLKMLLDKLRGETNFRMTDRLYSQALAEGGELAPPPQKEP